MKFRTCTALILTAMISCAEAEAPKKPAPSRETPAKPSKGPKSVTDKVKDIVIEQLGVNPDQVVEKASFIEDLGADSLDTVELVMAFEEEFSIEIPDKDAEKLHTVGQAIKYIEQKQGKAKATPPKKGK